MLTRPVDLADGAIVRALEAGWGLAVGSIEHAPVGFGSHHWHVVDGSGTAWFATVDEPLEHARLHAALSTARELRDNGLTFVVAPCPTSNDDVLVPVGDRYVLALYPRVDGESFGWGEYRSAEQLDGMVQMVIALHGAVTTNALTDDFVLPHRDALAQVADAGPYSRATSDLLELHAQPLADALARYDDLVLDAHRDPRPNVVTHGETHAANSMRTRDGWVLIDWDTVLLAPPERDMWRLDPGDGSSFRAYEAATATRLEPQLIELYRLRWDLADLCLYAHRFGQPHVGDGDDDKSWLGVRTVLGRFASS